MDWSGKRILVVSLSGIGNTLLLTPFLAALREQASGAHTDLLLMSSAMAEAIKDEGLVDECLIFPRNGIAAARCVLQLRRRSYAASVIAHPSNQWPFHLLARLIGAPLRIAHRYATPPWRSLAFLQTRLPPAADGLHDVEQNLLLLHGLGLDPSRASRRLHLQVRPADLARTRDWIRRHASADRTLVALHPGGGGSPADWQGTAKRWPAAHYAALADLFIERHHANILLMGGTEEKDLKNRIQNASRFPEHCLTADGSFMESAALLAQTRLFVGNDSSLMHAADALGVPVLGLFGPTNPARTAPRGPNAKVVRLPLPCSPCLHYPFHTMSSRIRCPRNHECLHGLSVEQVYLAASEMLEAASSIR